MEHEQGSSSLVSNTLKTWIEYNFPILVEKLETGGQNNDIEATKDNLMMLPLNFCLQSFILPRIEEHIRKIIAPKFWSNFINANKNDKKQGFQNFTSSVSELYHDSSTLLPMLKKLELADFCKHDFCIFSQINTLDYFKLTIKGTLLSQIPLYYTIIIEQFYKTAFNVFCNIEASGTSDNFHNSTTALCEGCEQEQNYCQCQAIVNIFHETNKKLIELDLLERLVESTLARLIHIRIESHVKRVCSHSIDVTQLKKLENWLETVVMNWLIRIYSGGSARSLSLDQKVRNAINAFKQKLVYFLYETYTRVRIDQLFNIVIEYPESCASIDDLRVCLKRTDLRKYLIRSLKEALKNRLLHPGVSTPDILTAYIAAIKALRQLDPSGLLLETITEPLKIYLRGREDTVRCVVHQLLNETRNSDLSDELAFDSGAFELRRLNTEGLSSPQIDTDDWETWQPDSIDADPEGLTFTSEGQGAEGYRCLTDVISMLVNVYGSQDLFVNEYRTLLADRLLSQLNFQTERELRHLDLLKRRFGEQQLHHCDIMLKDIFDSKRINCNIQAKMGNEEAGLTKFTTSALILSAQFWPPFKEDWKLELPNQVQYQLDHYGQTYETLKANRTLCWKAHLGVVNLDIETDDRKLNFNVSPMHATIILHFEQQNEWSLDQLAEVMHVPTTVLRRRISYWVSQGLISETACNIFTLQEKQIPENFRTPQCSFAVTADAMLYDEELESVMASASDQREEELQVFWSYIVGMLTNLDSMPLERIHQMLKMFASQGSGAVECGLPELKLFLDKKVREHQLLFSGGFYKLPKS